jgi:hypothetical protein
VSTETLHGFLQDLNDRLLAVHRVQGNWHTSGATTSQGFCAGCLQTPDELKQARTLSTFIVSHNTYMLIVTVALQHSHATRKPTNEAFHSTMQIVEQAHQARLSSGSQTLSLEQFLPHTPEW